MPRRSDGRAQKKTMSLLALVLAGSAVACPAATPPAAPDAPRAVDSDQACETDEDCVFSAVWRAVETAEDCHWSCCSGAVMNRTAAERFQAGIQRWCAGRSDELQAPCASATCEMRGQPRCMDGRCAEMQPDDFAGTVLPLAPATVAVYVGVDGVSFSTDGSPCGKYPEYADRETVVRVPAEDVDRAVADLRGAGFFQDQGPVLGSVPGIPPESLVVRVQSEPPFLCF